MREYLTVPSEQPLITLNPPVRQSLRPSTGKTSSEQIVIANPMRFFSVLNEIEDRIAREAVAIYAARQWKGLLGQKDWEEAEDRLLDRPPVRINMDGDVLELRIYTREYAPQDIAVHVEGDLLCICALRESTCQQGNDRMFLMKVKIPACSTSTNLVSSRENGFFSISLGIASAAKTAHGLEQIGKSLLEKSMKVA